MKSAARGLRANAIEISTRNGSARVCAHESPCSRRRSFEVIFVAQRARQSV